MYRRADPLNRNDIGQRPELRIAGHNRRATILGQNSSERIGVRDPSRRFQSRRVDEVLWTGLHNLNWRIQQVIK